MSIFLDRANQLSWAIACRQNKNFSDARSASKFLLQGSRPVQDPTVVKYIKEIFEKHIFFDVLQHTDNLLQFVDRADLWIKSHHASSITGLDGMHRDFSAGTTQSFDSFYYRHRHRRMRCFVGEYFYHLKTWNSNNTVCSFVDDENPLETGDALVISVPFCDTGNTIHDLNETLTVCDRLNIPVLVDCCYYTISSGINVDLSNTCIDTVSFSLSKAFPIANLRIGLRYTKTSISDGQSLLNSVKYSNNLSAYVGIKLIERFGPDYIYDLYLNRQHEVCRFLDLTPSQSVIFANGNKDWDAYNRSNLLRVYRLEIDPRLFNNRICLVSIFDNWDIFQHIKNETTN